MTPLRICMVTPYDLSDEGGVTKHARYLAAALRARGDHVDLIGPDSQRMAPRAHEIGVCSSWGVVNIPANGSANYIGVFANPWRVRALLARGRYDLVHIHEPAVPSLSWYAAWFAGRAARIATFHAFTEVERAPSAIARRLLVAPHLRTWFTRAIAVSPAAATYARHAWSGPLPIIPNGICSTTFAPSRDRRRAGPPRVLFVGQWRNPRKGIDVLHAAFVQLGARGHEVQLDVVGLGPSAQQLRDPRVTYHGTVSETRLAQLYRDADVFVAPSLGKESFGIVLLEAMASGRPIVCSDIAGYRAVAPSDGSVRFVAGDVAGLVNALVPLLADEALRERMGRSNRAHALRYDWAHVAAEVRAVYDDALGRKSLVVKDMVNQIDQVRELR